MNPIQAPESDDLVWDAFRYVSGEMNAAEEAAFESQMASDQAICDAVVEATQLVYGVAAGKAEIESRSPAAVSMVASRARSPEFAGRRLFAALATICCCVGLLYVAVNFSSDGSSNLAENSLPEAEAELLVAAWVDSGMTENEELGDREDADEGDLEVPDWMLAGLTLSDLEDPDGTDMPLDNGMPGELELF